MHKYILNYIFWFIVFSQGIISYVGLPSAIYKAGIPVIVIILFFDKLLSTDRLKVNNLSIFLSLGFVTIISFLLNEIDGFSFAYFLVKILFPYLYFIIIINEQDERLKGRILKLIITLVVLQIPSSIIKYFILGQTEGDIIGTIATSEGSVATIFPLYVISYLMPFLLHYKKMKYFLLIMLFIVFGFIGAKRAVVFYLPIIMALGSLYYVFIFKNKPFVHLIKYMFIIAIITSSFFYFGVRALPTLNPDNVIGGRFDLDYAINYAEEYSRQGNFKYDIPRYMGVLYFVNKLYNNGPLDIFFGEGPGKLILSKYNKNANIVTSNIAESEAFNNVMYYYYGIFYGGRMGFVWVMMQIGILGALLFASLLMVVKPKKPNNLEGKLLFAGFLTSYFVIFFDILYYANVFIEFPSMIYVHFFVAAFIHGKFNIARHSTIQNVRCDG